MPGAQEFLDAFWELSTDRRFAGAPIPAQSVQTWPTLEPDLLRACIRAMDDVFLKHYSKPPDQRGVLTPDAFKAMAQGKK